jgi:predicted RNase H-like HicB family nuclease
MIFTVTHELDYVILSNDELNVFGYGRTIEKAKIMLKEDLTERNQQVDRIVYQITEADGTEQWICEYLDLKGCIGVGDTYDEAVKEGEANKAVWLKTDQEKRKLASSRA